MKITNKLFLFVLTITSFVSILAQGPISPPGTPGGGAPGGTTPGGTTPGASPPGTPGGGALGATTPGVQSIPVDMYTYVLAIVAITMIVFFTKKYKSQKNIKLY